MLISLFLLFRIIRIISDSFEGLVVVRKRKLNSSSSEEDDECLSSDTMDGEKENEIVFNDSKSTAVSRKKKSAKGSNQTNETGQRTFRTFCVILILYILECVCD